MLLKLARSRLLSPAIVGVGLLLFAGIGGSADTGSVTYTTQDCTARFPGVNLAGCLIEYPQTLSGNLVGANLAGALLIGDVGVTGVNLTAANLTGARLYHASLAGANLTYANMYGANLTHSSLLGASLYGANVVLVAWLETICPDGSSSVANGTSPESCLGHGGGL